MRAVCTAIGSVTRQESMPNHALIWPKHYDLLNEIKIQLCWQGMFGAIGEVAIKNKKQTMFVFIKQTIF